MPRKSKLQNRKGKILKMLEEGKSLRKIAKELGVSHTAISKFVRKELRSGMLPSKVASGNFPKFPPIVSTPTPNISWFPLMVSTKWKLSTYGFQSFHPKVSSGNFPHLKFPPKFPKLPVETFHHGTTPKVSTMVSTSRTEERDIVGEWIDSLVRAPKIPYKPKKSIYGELLVKSFYPDHRIEVEGMRDE